MSTDADKFGALIDWGYNNGATNINSKDFALNALASAVFNTTIVLGGSENVFQRQTVPCDPNTEAFGPFTDNDGCKACRAARTAFEDLRFSLDTQAITNSNGFYQRPTVSSAVADRFHQANGNDICKFVCASCVVLNTSQGSRSSISSTQQWDDNFNVEFKRQLSAGLAAQLQEQSKQMEKWLKDISYETDGNGVYKACKQIGFDSDCISPVQADLEQRIEVTLTSNFKVEIIEKIRASQTIEILPSESIWVTDVSQSFTGTIVNEVVSNVMRDVTFYNQQILQQQLAVFEQNKALSDTMNDFLELGEGFENSIIPFLAKIVTIILSVFVLGFFIYLLYKNLKPTSATNPLSK